MQQLMVSQRMALRVRMSQIEILSILIIYVKYSHIGGL